MRSHLLAASALCLLMNTATVLAQEAQDRPPAPVSPLPEDETPQDQTDYQIPAEPAPTAAQGPAAQTPGVPATPPGAPETPSTAPATSPAASAELSQSAVEPAAGGMVPMDKYLSENGETSRQMLGERRSQLIKKPVFMPSGEEAGTIQDFVVRDGRNYALLTLPKTSDDRERDVVAPLAILSVSSGGDRVVIQAESRAELKKLPGFMPDGFQKMKL